MLSISLALPILFIGFATAKGEMVRSILYPKPVNMKFYSGTVKFLSVSWVLGKQREDGRNIYVI